MNADVLGVIRAAARSKGVLKGDDSLLSEFCLSRTKRHTGQLARNRNSLQKVDRNEGLTSASASEKQGDWANWPLHDYLDGFAVPRKGPIGPFSRK